MKLESLEIDVSKIVAPRLNALREQAQKTLDALNHLKAQCAELEDKINGLDKENNE